MTPTASALTAAQQLVRLERQPPARPRHHQRHRGRRGSRPPRHRRAAGSGGCAKSQRSNASRSVPACGQTSFSSSPDALDDRRSRLGADADPVDARDAPAACRCSRSRSRSRRACSASTSASSTCSIGSPPVSTTKRGRSARAPDAPRPPRPARRHRRTCRRPRHRCRRNRCRRSGRPRSRGPARAPTRGCIRRSARTPRAARVHALALQRQEHLLDRVAHARLDRRSASDRRPRPRRTPSRAAGSCRTAPQCSAAGRRIVARPAQPHVEPQPRALADDVRLGHVLERRVDAEAARPRRPALVASSARPSNAAMNSGRQSG